jgi:UDP-N-acetylmuramoylalanine--D-glutamate ligase
MTSHAHDRVLVLGLAASGEAAARLLRAEGAEVLVADQADSDRLQTAAAALEREGVRVRLGCALPPREPWALAVVSPGIRLDSEPMRALGEWGVPVISELELGWSRASCRTLAITGSNGKSTLTALCAAAFQAAGLRAEPAGNFGPPVSRVVREQRDLDWLVLEVSSFQLETVSAFRPDIGVLLNVLPNHLDRHGDFEAYRALKCRLFGRMRAGDAAVVPEFMAGQLRSQAAGANRWVSFGVAPETDYRYEPGRVIARPGVDCPERILDLAETYFDNEILGLAAAAAWAAADTAGVPLEAMVRALRGFRPLPHRLQEVVSARGVRFVDDSKATNVAAMLAALRMTPAPIRLIAGGLPKHESFEPALPLIRERVASVYLIGSAAADMAAAWSGAVPCKRFPSLAAAMQAAWTEASSGDTILLAPACASFDQFRSFEDRGEQFAGLARTLAAARRTLAPIT